MAETHLDEAKRQGYEPSDVSARGLLAVVAVSVVAVVLIVAALWGLMVLFESLRETGPDSPLSRLDIVPPEPRLDARPAQTLVELKRREDDMLATYGWVDQEAGIARIPITDAMELLAEQGWPAEGASAWPENEAEGENEGAER